jgi:hypothetical protein
MPRLIGTLRFMDIAEKMSQKEWPVLDPHRPSD